MRKKYGDLTKNTILFAISSFGAKIVSFLLLPLYTFVLTTGDYGTADLMTTAVSLLLPVLTINIQDAVLRFALDKRYGQQQVLSVAIRVVGIGTGILLFLLGLGYQSGLLRVEEQYLFFLIATFVSHSLYNVFSMYLKSIDKVKIFAVCGIINTLATAVLNIVLLVYVKMGITGYLIAYAGGSFVAVFCMVIWGKLYQDISLFHVDSRILKEMAIYSIPLIANSLAWWLNTASDRYILTFFCGAAVNGIYAVSYKIPTILSTLQHVFYNAWSVSAITEFDADDKDGFIGNIYALYMSVCILACSGIMLMNIPAARLLYAKDFFEAWKYVPPLLVGTAFNGLALFEGCLFTAVKKTKSISRTTMVGAGVNTILNFSLIPVIGAYGAAIATMVGYMVIWGVRACELRKIVKMKVNWFELGGAVALLMLQMIIAFYEKTQFIQILLIGALLFVLRKHFRGIMSTILKKIGMRR